MHDDLLHALCALAAFFIPMGFAWFMVARTARRHARRHSRKERRMR
ncbi:hypothetical protein [Variovorax sp. MHTC-1]|nr:hypothetical protein [Variovorax sp. MHTC-1]